MLTVPRLWQNARVNLEKALDEASKEGCGVTESEVAEHHYKLGRILWDLGGYHKTNPKKCRFHLEQASLEESDSQAWFLHLFLWVRDYILYYIAHHLSVDLFLKSWAA